MLNKEMSYFFDKKQARNCFPFLIKKGTPDSAKNNRNFRITSIFLNI